VLTLEGRAGPGYLLFGGARRLRARPGFPTVPSLPVPGTASASVTFASNASNSPAVESLTGTGNEPPQHSASLSWSPSTSEVVGYNVYRSSQPGWAIHQDQFRTGNSHEL